MTDQTPTPAKPPKNRRWITFGFIAATFIVVLIAGAVFTLGGGDDEVVGSPTPTPGIKGRAIIHIDLATIPAEVDATVRKVVKDRLDAANVFNIINNAPNSQIRVDFESQNSTNLVSDLVVTPGIRFKKPVRDGTAIKCKDTSGNEFSVEPETLTLEGNLPRCLSSDGRNGEVEWEAAIGQIDGDNRELTGALFVPEDVALPTDSTTGTPTLYAGFNDEGKSLLQQVTKDLVGYPLGVFLGDSLLLAARIQREITNGHITLAGASPESMLELRAIIKGGEIPVPVSLVSIEQQ